MMGSSRRRTVRVGLSHGTRITGTMCTVCVGSRRDRLVGDSSRRYAKLSMRRACRSFRTRSSVRVPIDGRCRHLLSAPKPCGSCLLYTSDAADEEDSVDLG